MMVVVLVVQAVTAGVPTVVCAAVDQWQDEVGSDFCYLMTLDINCLS